VRIALLSNLDRGPVKPSTVYGHTDHFSDYIVDKDGNPLRGATKFRTEGVCGF
jgi:hypothetical protein